MASLWGRCQQQKYDVEPLQQVGGPDLTSVGRREGAIASPSSLCFQHRLDGPGEAFNQGAAKAFQRLSNSLARSQWLVEGAKLDSQRGDEFNYARSITAF